MKIQVKDRGFKAANGLRDYVGLRLMSELDHLERRVNGVAVYLTDIDASGGGIDKRCRMLARLVPSGEVLVEATGPGLYAAIDLTAERLASAVARETTARRIGKTRPGAAPGGLRSSTTTDAPRQMGSR